MNSTYRIRFAERNKDDIVKFINDYSNDVVLNNIKDKSVGITIQSEQADEVYRRLLADIDRSMYLRRPYL